MHIKRAMEAMEGSGECMRQIGLKGTTEEENERSQIDCVVEKRSTDGTHSKARPLAYKEQGDETTICQMTFLKRWSPH